MTSRLAHRDRWLCSLLLAVVTLTGLGLRVWPVATRPLWHDEVMTWKAVVQSGLGPILLWTHHYEHPPLSYLLVWASMVAFGDAEWALRLPSLVCGVLSIPAAFLLGWMVRGKGVGLVAAGLVAFDYNQIIQSQQARMYTLTVLCVLLTLSAVLWAARRRWAWWRWAIVGTGLAAAFAASHMGLILWAALLTAAVFVTLVGRARERGLFAGAGVAYLTAAVWCSIGFVVMVGRIDWFAARSGATPLSERFAGLALDLGHAYGHLAVGLTLLGVAAVGLVRMARQERLAALLLAGLMVFNAVLVLPVMPHGWEARPRYLIVGQVAVWLGAAYLAWGVRGRAWRVTLLVALAAVSAWLTAMSLSHGDHWRYEYGAVMQAVRAEAAPGDQVVFYPAWIEAVPWYYGLRATHEAAPAESGAWAGQSELTEAPFAAIDPARPTWVVAAYLHTGARDWVDEKVGEIAARYGVRVERERAAALAQRHAVVVARVSRDGVTLRGYGEPEE